MSKHCVCYVWNACQGGLIGNEFASCAVDFLTSDLSSNEYVVYSDGCGYQNRNATLASALSYFSHKFGKTVTQNILEKGHNLFVCLVGFLTSSSTTRLYRGRAPRQERLTILRAATHETELGDNDFCLSRSHYTDNL